MNPNPADQPPGAAPAPAHAAAGRCGAGELAALLAILGLALLLRLWGLEQNGWGAEYYSAAVRSMAESWHNFFFVAFDPEGFISVDKPPLALWLQVACVKLFGYAPPSLLVPQAAMGTVAVALVFHLVRRRFGVGAGLLAALFLAVTPVAVAVNRSNNMDTCLLLLLLLAAWALLKAAESGRRALLLLAMVFVGLAFNVKMLAAFVVLPTFFLAYLACAPLPWRRRVVDLMLAALVVAAVALPWVLAYDLTPPEQRPYVGSSARNAMLELVVGHNALGRFVMRDRRAEDGAAPDAAAEAGRARFASRLFVRAPTGPLRLAEGRLAAQAAWLLPLALAALAAGRLRGRAVRAGGSPPPARLDLLVWFGWLATYGAVYSYAGGIIHYYYLATLGPPLAALAAVGLAYMWRGARQGGRGRLLLAAALGATVAWQMYIEADALGWSPSGLFEMPRDGLGWLHAATMLAVPAAAALLLPWRGARARGALAAGLAALLALPTAWALSSVLVPVYGLMPSADLARLRAEARAADARLGGQFGHAVDRARLAQFILENRQGERFALATTTTQVAAPIIIRTGAAVMAMGGFHGLDPAIAPDRLARLVQARELRFVLLGDASIVSRRMGSEAAGRAVADWVRQHGRPVPPAEWGAAAGARGGLALYDLRPAAQGL